MTAFWAIVLDTWRQSKHQWVMILMIAVVAIYVPFAVLFPKVRLAPDGSEVLSHVHQRETDPRTMDTEWEGVYADALRDELGYDEEITQRSRELNKLLEKHQDLDFEIKRLQAKEPDNPTIKDKINELRELERERDRGYTDVRNLRMYVQEEIGRITSERTGNISKLQKGVEYWMSSSATFLFQVTLFIYLFVCAGFIPEMIRAGSIDLVLSKPIRRWHIYFGRYVGGLMLYSGVLLVAYALIFTGTGLRTGVWHWRFFGGLPMTLFSAALLFSIIGWVGLWTRSTLMSAILGLVYYVIVDTAIGYLGDIGSSPFISDMQWLEQFSDFTKLIFPSFVWLRESAEGAVLSVYVFPWKHLIVGIIWLIVCLGTSYNRFRINDY